MIAFNFIMAANPIGLIVIVIAAFIALLVAVIAKWDEWGAAVTIFLGPLGFVIAMVQSFRRNWDALVKAFKTGGILSIIKAIALVIADGLLMPIEQLLRIFNKFTGIDLGIGAIAAVREAILTNLNTLGGDATPSVNPPATQQRALIERSETVEEQRIKLQIESDQAVSIAENSTTGVEILLPSTLNFD